MKNIFFYLFITSLACINVFISCKKEYSCEGCINGNKPPIANAGPDQTITLPTDSVLLDGRQSSDPDGAISSFLWTKISGPAAFVIIQPSDSTANVKSLIAGTYQFQLKVTDNGGRSTKDTVQVIVNDPSIPNRPPIANAGSDQTITLQTNTVNLDGSGSTDPDNNITNYAWTKVSGPSSFNIINASIVQTQVSSLVQGVYQFELKVTDAGGLFSKDTMQVKIITSTNGTCSFNNLPYRHATLTQIGSLSVPRMPVAVTAVNKVIFAGGWANLNCSGNGAMHSSPSSVVDIFDITNHIRTTAQLSMPRGGIRTVSCGDKVFFAGGENGISTTYDNVDIYDISTNTWTVAHLSSPRAYVATATVGDKVFFAGGHYYSGSSPLSHPNNASNKVDIYDLSSNQWTTATLSGTATDLYTATALAGKIYFAGGNNNGIVDIYDNTTNTWSTYNSQVQWSPMGWNMANPFVSFTAGNNIYWAGIIDEGYDPNFDDNVYTGRAEILNTVNNTTSLQCIPVISSRFPVLRNNEVAFFAGYAGGMFGGWSIHNSFSIYNTTTGNWSIGRTDFNFFTGGYDAGIVSAHNKIYVGGGSELAPGSCLIVSSKVYILNW